MLAAAAILDIVTSRSSAPGVARKPVAPYCNNCGQLTKGVRGIRRRALSKLALRVGSPMTCAANSLAWMLSAVCGGPSSNWICEAHAVESLNAIKL